MEWWIWFSRFYYPRSFLISSSTGIHRFQHESLLWQEHKLHHMDEQLCAFYRESWLETLIAGPLATIPLAILFKLNASQGAITGAMFTAWVVLLHTNIRLHLGPFAVLFNGPQGHRIHHSRKREHYDQNFAAFFPIWDVLFGTYHYPKRDEYPLTGVQGEKEVQTLLEAAMLPFREWTRCSAHGATATIHFQPDRAVCWSFSTSTQRRAHVPGRSGALYRLGGPHLRLAGANGLVKHFDGLQPPTSQATVAAEA